MGPAHNQENSAAGTTIFFNRKWLVGDGNRLVLVVDEDAHALRLDSVDSSTNLLVTLAESTRTAILADGVFGGNLEFDALTVSNGLYNVTGNGAIQVRGRVHRDLEGNAVNVTGQLIGVLNDSIDGNLDAGDVLIKATILPAGSAFDAEEFGL